jgi:hypothetical protein
MAQTYDPNYTICLQVYAHYGYIDCSFTSMPQCNATASGRGAECFVNHTLHHLSGRRGGTDLADYSNSRTAGNIPPAAEGDQIMRTFIFVLVAVVPAFAVGRAWAADDLPTFDIVKNCKAEDAGADTGAKACTIDETNAKNELAKSWSSYSASAKKDCIGEASIGGDKSYVELLTCLEMTTGKLDPREDRKQ